MIILKLGRYRASAILRTYKGADRRGLNRFGNGWGYRIGNSVFRVWRLSDNDYSPSRLRAT